MRERKGPKWESCIDTDSEPEQIMAGATHPIGKQAMNVNSISDPSRRGGRYQKKEMRVNRQISWAWGWFGVVASVKLF